MPDFAEPLARLIQEVKRLPGIGQKSAQRLAFHVLRSGREEAERFAAAILDVKDKTHKFLQGWSMEKVVKEGIPPACVKHCQAGCMMYGPVKELAKVMEKKSKTVLFAPR